MSPRSLRTMMYRSRIHYAILTLAAFLLIPTVSHSAEPPIFIRIDGTSETKVLVAQDGSGTEHTIDLNIDATIRVGPATLRCEENGFVSERADFSGTFRVWGTAVQTRANEQQTLNFDHTHPISPGQIQRVNVRIAPRFEDDVYMKTVDGVVVQPNQIRVYAVEYVASLGIARVWVSLQSPFLYSSELEHYDIPATHSFENLELAPACLVVELVDRESMLPLGDVPVRLGDTERRTDSSGLAIFDPFAPGTFPLEILEPGIAVERKIVRLRAFDIQHIKLFADVQVDLTGDLSKPLHPLAVMPDQQNQVEFTLRNAGSGELHDPTSVEVFLSKDEILDPTDQPIGSASVKPPMIGQSIEIPIRFPRLDPALFSEAGIRFLLARIVPPPDVDDINPGNNVVVSAPFWSGNIVLIVTHGFNPTPPEIFWWKPWEEFRETGFAIGQALALEPEPDTLLDGRIRFHVSEWDSSKGFWEAFVVLFVSKLAEANAVVADRRGDPLAGTLFLVSEEMKRIAHELAKTSSVLAVQAGSQIFRSVQESLLLPDKSTRNAFQKVILVGHSRGAAVNARIARILFNEGIECLDFVSLDGFSTDWPDDGHLIADISISTETVATRKHNFRVENDLASWIVDEITLDSRIGQLFLDAAVEITRTVAKAKFPPLRAVYPKIYPDAEVRAVMDGYDLRAPERSPSGFIDSTISEGTIEPSNHVNIQQLFLDSRNATAAEAYIYRNFIGENRMSTDQLIYPRARQAGPGNVAMDVDMPTIPDGEFTSLGNTVVNLQSYQRTGADLFDIWADFLGDPDRILNIHWPQNDGVTLLTDGDNARVRMTASMQSFLERDIRLIPAANQIDFDVIVPEAPPPARFRVVLAGNAVFDRNLTDLKTGFQTITVPFESFDGMATLRMELTNSGSHPAIMELDNIRLQIAAPVISRLTALSHDEMLVEATGIINQRYALESSPDMIHWNQVASIQPDSSQFDLKHTSLNTRQFYRIRTLPY